MRTDLLKFLYIKFPTTETEAFRAFQEMKNSELASLKIVSMDERAAKQIPVHAHDECFLFN
jgi:hypothetical protein